MGVEGVERVRPTQQGVDGGDALIFVFLLRYWRQVCLGLIVLNRRYINSDLLSSRHSYSSEPSILQYSIYIPRIFAASQDLRVAARKM